jgi:hypothetical protein
MNGGFFVIEKLLNPLWNDCCIGAIRRLPFSEYVEVPQGIRNDMVEVVVQLAILFDCFLVKCVRREKRAFPPFLLR